MRRKMRRSGTTPLSMLSLDAIAVAVALRSPSMHGDITGSQCIASVALLW
jgi:hypothetical protein